MSPRQNMKYTAMWGHLDYENVDYNIPSSNLT